MCGRFSLSTDSKTISQHLRLDVQLELMPRFNIAPTQGVVAVRYNAPEFPNQTEACMLRWGLIPSWAKDPSIGNRMINARSETAREKPAFRSAFKYRRCLVLADGFYEWKKEGKAKQPYWIQMADEKPFAFAGLWEHWQDPGGNELDTCTILTTSPNELMKSIHDRMPVILEPDNFDLWLKAEPTQRDELQSLMKPLPAELMMATAVSTFVNKPGNDDARCIEPQQPGLF